MLIALAQAMANIGASLAIFSSHPVPAEFCAHLQGVEHCYYRGDSESRRVVYYLHGFGEDVEGWTYNYSTGEVEKYWARHHSVRPHVVTISKGVWWYTGVEEGKELLRFVEAFEQRYLSFVPERVLYGESMGGHNALRWVLDQPDLFKKIAVLCPALPRSFVNSPGPSQGFLPYEILAEQLIAEFYKQSAHVEFNPLTALSSATQFPKSVHLIATPRDQYGFWSGALDLKDRLAGLPEVVTTFEAQNIDHCNLATAETLAKFLTE